MELHVYRPGQMDLKKKVVLQERTNDGSKLTFTNLGNGRTIRIEGPEGGDLVFPDSKKAPPLVRVFEDGEDPREGYWRRIGEGALDFVQV